MQPFLELCCYPPLGQLSVFNAEEREIIFTVFCDWFKQQPPDSFQVEVCYSNNANNKHESQWSTVRLNRVGKLPHAVRDSEEPSNHAAFTGTVSVGSLAGITGESKPAHIFFTLRYRISTINAWSAWKWAGGSAGIAKGELLLCLAAQEVSDADAILSLDQTEAKWKCTALDSSQPSGKVWELSSTDPIPRDSDALTPRTLGHIKNLIRYTAIVRLEDYWIGVYSDKDFFHLTEDGILLLFLTSTGSIIALLALNAGEDTYTVFRSGPNGEIVVAARNDGSDEASFQCLMAAGQSHQEAIQAVMAEARTRVHKRSKIQSLSSRTSSLPNVSADNSSFIDGLSFCTWNSLGQNLTADKVVNAVDTLSSNNINISTLLIDDNWQTLGPTSLAADISNCDTLHRGFADFPANETFPNGLKGLTTSIRKQHPHIKHIGVWHALFGYWAGMSPNSPLAKTYKTHEVTTNVMGTPGTITIIHPSSVHQFYDDFYKYLSSQGVDFVKTDVQHMLSLLSLTSDRESIIHEYQSAWTTAYTKYFSGRAISCMSQQPEILLHSVLQSKTPKILMRNSDDFFPHVPGSHPWHVFVNAYNALLTSELNVVPDWDMFESKHEGGYSGFHAAARAVSGGPVMITDTPGEHDVALIEALSAKTVSGRMISLRTGPGMVSKKNIWERYGDRNVLKIVSRVGGGENTVGMLGLFNIAEGERHVLIGLDDLEGLHEEKEYMVLGYRTGQIFGPITRKKGSNAKPEELIQLKLDIKGWEILTAYSVHQVGDTKLAVLGLLGKMSGPAAVTSQSVSDKDGKQALEVKLKAVGKLAIWMSDDHENMKHTVTARTSVGSVNEDTYKWVPVDQKYLKITPVSRESKTAHVVEIDMVRFFNDNNFWGHGDAGEEELLVNMAFSTQ